MTAPSKAGHAFAQHGLSVTAVTVVSIVTAVTGGKNSIQFRRMLMKKRIVHLLAPVILSASLLLNPVMPVSGTEEGLLIDGAATQEEAAAQEDAVKQEGVVKQESAVMQEDAVKQESAVMQGDAVKQESAVIQEGAVIQESAVMQEGAVKQENAVMQEGAVTQESSVTQVVAEEINGCKGTIDESTVREKYGRLTLGLIENKLQITTMESCTSGQVASLLTDTEGSSAVVKGAFITYSNEAKIRQGVPAQLIERYGVYSPETAASMAENCRASFSADIGIGVTGSFGNVDPANPDSIPGEVFFAIACEKGTSAYHCTIPEQPSRLDYKLYMADLIANRLLLLLSSGYLN